MRKSIVIFLCLFSAYLQGQTLWGGYIVDISRPDSLGKTNLQAIADFVKQQTVGRATGQTAANSSIATLTVGGADASYMVSGNILITTSGGSENISLEVSWTDEGNTARTAAITLLRINAGVWLNSTIGGLGAVPYPGASMQLRCKASTAITIKTSGIFTGTTYNVEGRIQKI